jgi:hypothetical protein
MSIAAPMTVGFNGVAHRVLGELEAWGPRLQRGAADDGAERFAVRVDGVRAAGLGHPGATGTLSVTDRRALLTGPDGEPLREWALADLDSVTALGNWGGIALVHAGGEMELVVSARSDRPGWEEAAGWLKAEAAFAAAADRLAEWLSELPERLTADPPGALALAAGA